MSVLMQVVFENVLTLIKDNGCRWKIYDSPRIIILFIQLRKFLREIHKRLFALGFMHSINAYRKSLQCCLDIILNR